MVIDKIISWGTLLLFTLVFVLGGIIQFVIGIPTTLYTLVIVAFLYALILVDILNRKKILVNRVILSGLLFLLIIILSGLLNKSGVFKIWLYSLFVLIPMGVFYLFHILKIRNIPINDTISVYAKYIVLLQLPVVLLQRFGYKYLIPFNNSNQSINDYDFMFGTFFIRADHALGFFLLVNLLLILKNVQDGFVKKFPLFLSSYIGVTILLTGSNLSKLFLFIILAYFAFKWLYRKIKFIGVIGMILVGFVLFRVALTVPAIEGEYNNFTRNYSVEKSYVEFKRGTAKRPQIIIAYLSEFPLKYIGEGPYDYYDILKGKFKQTQHFSQIIWTYNDLGIVGILTLFLLVFSILRGIGLDNSDAKFLLLGLLLFYLLMTNVFYDLAMCFSLLLVQNRSRRYS